MNKYKKIAASIVSIVMAGTMIGSLAACGENNGGNGGGGGGGFTKRSTSIPKTRFNASANEIETKNGLSVLKSDNTKLAYPAGTVINSNIIDSANKDRKISYDSGQIATYWKGLDGYTYTVGDLKPAWWQLGQDLGIKFVDKAQGTAKSGEELSTAISEGLSKYTFINASMSELSVNTNELLDIGQYLDYMPNFKHFLDEYPIVKWSLTTDNQGGMYYIPYFDGNDDIEKYPLIQRDWVRVILDDALPTTDTSVTYKAQQEAKRINTLTVKVEPFMGTTGKWTVKTTNPANEGALIDLTVDYDAVIAALGDSSSGLATAIAAIQGATVGTASGNIVSIQNDIINSTNGAVKGSELIKVLREYIKVAYKNGTNSFYTKLSDVFLSTSAAWDADLLTGLYRCVVTNFKSFKGMSGALANNVYALAGRNDSPQRINDLLSLAGELYGVRGFTSRLLNLYFDKDGNLKDNRLDTESYDAAAKLYAFTQEGLLYATGAGGSKAVEVNKVFAAGKTVTGMLYDYCQTQTKDGFTNEDFDLAPIVTPVSKWNDGNGEKIMRFTESWRSVKNSGVVIPKVSVSDPNVLSAVITFIDYLYSNDGQIVASYGPMSTNGNGEDANGFWYGEDGVEVLDAQGNVKSEFTGKVATSDGKQYYLVPSERANGFMFKNVYYKGVQYKPERQVPIMTDNNMKFYLGETVNGNAMGATSLGYKKTHAGNYTDYARGVVGSALPIGNKDQGFEYQCTAACGLEGSEIVSKAIGNGAIKHLELKINTDTEGGSWWYTEVPSAFPLDKDTQTALSYGNGVLNGTSTSAGVFNATSGPTVSNVYIDLAFHGYHTGSGQAIRIGGCGSTTTGVTGLTMKADATSMLEAIKDLGKSAANGNKGYLVYQVDTYATAWTALKALMS